MLVFFSMDRNRNNPIHPFLSTWISTWTSSLKNFAKLASYPYLHSLMGTIWIKFIKDHIACILCHFKWSHFDQKKIINNFQILLHGSKSAIFFRNRPIFGKSFSSNNYELKNTFGRNGLSFGYSERDAKLYLF